MNFYRRFPGDYARDTKHLSLVEHGVYTLLLDYYYSTEKPIPSLELAYALCGARHATHFQAVRTILKNFFAKTTYGYKNKRVEEELKHLAGKRESAKNSAKARWNPSKRNANASPNASQTQYEEPMRSHGKRNAIQTLDSRLQKEPSRNGHPQDQAPVQIDDLKKSVLAKCEGPTAQIAAMLDIIHERAIKSGTEIRTEAYLFKALDSFDVTGGQDKEDLQQFLRRAPH